MNETEDEEKTEDDIPLWKVVLAPFQGLIMWFVGLAIGLIVVGVFFGFR